MNEKRSFTLICLLILYVGLAKAQYCNVQRGAKLYYKTIDIKSKTTTIDISHIAEVYEKGDDLIVKQLNYGKKMDNSKQDSLQIQLFIYDKKSETQVVFIDGETENEQTKQMMASHYPKEKKVDFEKTYSEIKKRIRVEGRLSIPLKSDVKKGDDVPACKVSYKVGFMKMSAILSGKYEGFETIYTPAGKFDCLKVSYVVQAKMMLMSEKTYITEWYAVGVGLVKNEESTKKGIITSTSILTSILSDKGSQ